jgi:transcriptional regulator GlxA family with amidase domain
MNETGMEARMSLHIGIYLFDQVEALDFAGPYEVFTTASRVALKREPDLPVPFTVSAIAQDLNPVRARAGLQIVPDHSNDQHPPVDVLVVPGGVVTAEMAKQPVTDWIARTAATSQLTASVCTGAFLLAQAGVLHTQRCTTHWEDVADLQAQFPALQVLDGPRWVSEGAVLTSAGISAGIDMSLHLVERLAGRELALATARQMDYAWHEALGHALGGAQA